MKLCRGSLLHVRVWIVKFTIHLPSDVLPGLPGPGKVVKVAEPEKR